APGCVLQPATGAAGGWVAVQPGGEVVGEARALEADAPVWAAPLFGFEVRLLVTVPEPARYRPLPTQPPVERDVALLLPAGVNAAAVSAVLARTAGPLLARLDVFDEYRGAGVPAGHRSVAWHCTFRDPSRTLREREVDELLARALQALEDERGVRRRRGGGEGGRGGGAGGGSETRPRAAQPCRRSGAGEQDVAPARGGRARARARPAVAPDIPRGAGPPARRQRWRKRQRAELRQRGR